MSDVAKISLHGFIPRGIITSFDSMNCLGDSSLCGRQTGASTQNPVVNVATFMPVSLERETVVSRLGWYNGAAVVGNVDCGVYSWSGSRLVSTGSTAQSGVSAPQEVDVANVVLPPGDYRLALAHNSSGAVFREAAAAVTAIASGVTIQTSAFPLPATATFVAPSTAFWPMCWINTRDNAI